MNSKKVLIVLFGVASAAIWGPQAWSMYQAKQEPEKEYPRADELGGLESPGSTPKGSVAQGQGIQAIKRDTSAATESPLQAALGDQGMAALVERSAEALGGDAPGPGTPQISQLLGVLETFSGANTEGLSKLLETTPSWMQDNEAETESSPNSEASDLAAQLEIQTQSKSELAELDMITSYLEQAPLTAIVKSKSGAWALLGGHIIRKGDVLLPNLLSVKNIGRTGITLMSPTGPLQVALPAFRTAQPKVSSDSDPLEQAPAEETPSDSSTMPDIGSFPSMDPS